MKKFDVGIIIINYNNSALSIACVKSIIARTNPAISYIISVVDNASAKEDFTALKLGIEEIDQPNVVLVRSMINTGFGGGNMMGVQNVDAEYYAFINNDTILLNDCIAILKAYMDQNASVAIAGPELQDENNNIQVGFDHFTSLQRELLGKATLEFFNPKKYPARRKQYETPLPVSFVNGSFMFCRAADFNDVGGFDTNIFLFYEEDDLCHRLLNNSKETHFVPEAKYIHYQGQSMPAPMDTKLELKTSLFYVTRKHQGYLGYQALRIFYLIRYTLTCIVKPKYLPLLYRIIIGMPLSKSLKHQQKIIKD